MEDTYVYVAVKLYLKDGQTQDSIENILEEMEVSIDHDQITENEVGWVIDTQLPEDVKLVSSLFQSDEDYEE